MTVFECQTAKRKKNRKSCKEQSDTKFVFKFIQKQLNAMNG